jgi:hypothetical protein
MEDWWLGRMLCRKFVWKPIQRNKTWPSAFAYIMPQFLGYNQKCEVYSSYRKVILHIRGIIHSGDGGHSHRIALPYGYVASIWYNCRGTKDAVDDDYGCVCVGVCERVYLCDVWFLEENGKAGFTHPH